MPKYEAFIFIIWLFGTLAFSLIMRSLLGPVFSWSFSFPLVLGVSLILCFISIGIFHIARTRRIPKIEAVTSTTAVAVTPESVKDLYIERICSSCGSPISEESEFCPDCGTKL